MSGDDPPATLPADENLFLSRWGIREMSGWYGYGRRGQISDVVFDLRLRSMRRFREAKAAVARAPIRRVHVAAVEVASRQTDLECLLTKLSETRHIVTTSVAPMGDRGKFDNLNLALAGVDLDAVDWLILTDDDITVPDGFLDLFLYISEAASLMASMPAHRFHSHAAFDVTQRAWNSLVRVTRYVENGPLTAFRSPMFPLVLPFPVTRWSWGIDLVWSTIAMDKGWPIGVVDATPIEHRRPISISYDRGAATSEGMDFVASLGIIPRNRDFLRTIRTVRKLMP